jgi:uncharacterized membrane protein required for colicin V production
MISAAAVATPATNGMSFNWFDMVVVAVLGFGVFRGRRNGMSKELIPLLEWLALVSVCGLGYPMLAGVLDGFLPNKLWSAIAAYLAIAVAVFVIFALIKHGVADKLVKSDFFKGTEYYLGMVAGMVRYACMLVFVLALLNARVYTPAEIARQKAADQKNFGGGTGSGFQGNFFPHLFAVQAGVFKESFAGPLVKTNAAMLLINIGSAAPEPPKKTPVIQIGNPPTTPAQPTNPPQK